MSIDHYFERGLDRPDKGFMCVSDARRQLWFSVVVFGICVALFLCNLSTISSPRNDITQRGGAGVQQPQLMLYQRVHWGLHPDSDEDTDIEHLRVSSNR